MNRIEWARANPVACPLPHTITMVRPTEDGLMVGYCCNIQRHSHNDWEDFVVQLKTNMALGRPTVDCKRCYQEDTEGKQSERVRAILELKDNYEDVISGTSLEHHEIHINLGNLCPLACRSCQASESTTYGKITKTTVPVLAKEIVDDQEWYAWVKQRLIKVYENFDDPTVHFIGGETLVQPRLVVILDWLIDSQMAHKFTVALTTSLAVNLTQDLIQRLLKFYHVGLCLSIDSTGDNYHYVRWPVQFSKVQHNLEVLKSWRQLLPRTTVALTPVFSIGNIFYLDQYLDYWIKNDPLMNIYPIHLWWPDHMAVENLAPEYQSRLVEYIDDICKHDYFSTGKADVLLSLLQSFKDAKRADTDQLFCYNMLWMADYDARTGLHMEKFNTRLWQMLSQQHKKIYLDQKQKANISLPINHSVSRATAFQI